MGKAAGAVLTAAAPEARLASKAATAGGGRRSPVTDPRTSAPGSKAARQREDVERIKAARPAEPTPAPAAAPAAPPPSSLGGGLSLPSAPAPVSAAAATGSGFLLGVFVWAAGLAYLKHGPAGLKQFLGNKFLNRG